MLYKVSNLKRLFFYIILITNSMLKYRVVFFYKEQYFIFGVLCTYCFILNVQNTHEKDSNLIEPTGDLLRGSSSKFSDIVKTFDGSGFYISKNGTNLLCRLRIGGIVS